MVWQVGTRQGLLRPSQVPVHNRYEALQVDLDNTEERGTSGLEVTLRSYQAAPCIKSAPAKKKKKKKIGCSPVRLPSEGNCRTNIQTRPTGPDYNCEEKAPCPGSAL